MLNIHLLGNRKAILRATVPTFKGPGDNWDLARPMALHVSSGLATQQQQHQQPVHLVRPQREDL
jgi:hypothetical protein